MLKEGMLRLHLKLFIYEYANTRLSDACIYLPPINGVPFIGDESLRIWNFVKKLLKKFL